MEKKLISWIGGALMASMLWAPATVYAFQGTLTIRLGSINCWDQVTGGTRQTINDGAASCTIDIKEVAIVCKNKKGNADNSSSHIFALQGVPVSQSQTGKDFTLTKNGATLSDITFKDSDILNALIAAGAIPDLDTLNATYCPNRNWTATLEGVTRFDMVATVNGVANGYVPFFPASSFNPNGTAYGMPAFTSCDPNISGLTYTNDGGNSTSDESGILGECWIFRDIAAAGQVPDQYFPGNDRGGVALLDPNFTTGAFYNGMCLDHGKQNGSLSQSPPYTYNKWGPSPDDPECTGQDTVLDGSY